MKLTNEIMYQAIIDKNPSFEGLFFTAVKTTGIFCRPSCSARKPKYENVEFLTTTRDCMLKGYRPCKVCRPLENKGQTPVTYQQLMDELEQNPSIKFKDYDLKKKGIEPSQIRRWFLKNHGITFQAFQRISRINAAFKKSTAVKRLPIPHLKAALNHSADLETVSNPYSACRLKMAKR